ncbi:MAG: PHP-associated domain-containing protein, partial [Candidatus Cloacimonadales bacterium]|nr:PHP-associated domain-containing protein [Candidatus Cloacimonadales bacterium]
LETIFKQVKRHRGFAFPAHVDVATYSLLGQFGFMPSNLDIKAVGITAACNVNKLLQHYPFLQDFVLIRNSDAHCLQDIGSGHTEFLLKEPTLQEIIRAMNDRDSIRISSFKK